MNNAQTSIIIKELCKERNVSVSKMLVETSIRKSLIYDMEKRDYTPSAEILEKIADYLNCSVDYLLGRTDNPSATGGTYIKNNNHNVNQAINGDVNINTDTSEKDDKQLFDMIKELDLVQRSETIVYINNLKKKEGK